MKKREDLRKEFFNNYSSYDLPTALKITRKIFGKNQEEYSRMVGVSFRTIIDFERGKANPSLKILEKMFSPMGLKIGLTEKY